jgi:hypothetical protein
MPAIVRGGVVDGPTGQADPGNRTGGPVKTLPRLGWRIKGETPTSCLGRARREQAPVGRSGAYT